MSGAMSIEGENQEGATSEKNFLIRDYVPFIKRGANPEKADSSLALNDSPKNNPDEVEKPDDKGHETKYSSSWCCCFQRPPKHLALESTTETAGTDREL